MLELKSVSAGYGMTKVLRDVTISVPPGKVVALLGANGAGKTTLLRCAARVLPITSGQIALDGIDVTRLSSYKLARRGVTYIPDGQGVFGSLSVKENLALFRGRRRSADFVDEAVDMFEILGKRLSQTAGTMSGGEQQMLALVRAAVAGPQIALLDEVSMGLSPRIVDDVFVGLRRLAATGMSLLLVEQYVKRALEMADHVYLMSRGTIIYSGPPDELAPDELTRSYVGVDTSSVTSPNESTGKDSAAAAQDSLVESRESRT